MTLVTPFKAIHYNPKQVTLSDVITPPYDVITEEQGKAFLKKSPYNFAHVILMKKDATDYARVAERLKKWNESNVLSEDPHPHYYLYQQTFSVKGDTHTRNTLMSALQLSEFSQGAVRPRVAHGGPDLCDSRTPGRG